MFFKLIVTASTVLLSFFLNSCRWVGEKSPEPIKLEISNRTMDCFSGLGKKIEAYLNSELDEKTIDDFFSCTESSINDFMRKTKERDPEKGYSRIEIESLLKTFMLDDKSEVNSQRYSRLFLIVKRALIGGDPDYFKKSDWIKIKSIFPRVANFFQDTKPYMRFYYFYNKRKYCHSRSQTQLKERDQSQTQNQSFSCINLDSFKSLDISHDEFATRLVSFLKELKSFGSLINKNEIQYIKEEIVTFEALKKVEPLLDEMIYIFYSFPVSEHNENWGELVRLAERGLRVMTYVKRSALQGTSYFVPEGGVAIVALVRSVIDAFDLTYKINSSLSLNQELIERFIVSLSQSGIFLSQIKDPIEVKNFIANMGKSIFTSDNVNSWYVSNSKITHFKFMHNRWVNSLIKAIDGTSSNDLKEQYADLLFKNLDYDVDSIEQGEDVVNNVVRPSFINLAFPGLEYKINFQIPNNMNQSNSVTSDFYKTMMSNVVLFVFDTYGRQSRIDSNASKFVVEQTAKTFYNDIRTVAVTQGLGSPLSCDAGGRTFLEANLFGYSSNGNDKIEIQEALEWLTMATSSSSVAGKLFKNISEIPDCVLPGNSTFQNRPYLKQGCVKAYILENYSKYFNHMPNFVRYLETENNAEEFYRNIFEVTRTCDHTELPMSYDEIVYSVTLLGYIEALFERYDVEEPGYFFPRLRNDILEYDELSLAFNERFRPILQRIARMTSGVELSDSNTEHLFKKLLILKRLPETPSGTLQSVAWYFSDRLVNVLPLNRIDVYKVFNSILTMGETPAIRQEYCTNVSLAWEAFKEQLIFVVEPPENSCAVPAPATRTP